MRISDWSSDVCSSDLPRHDLDALPSRWPGPGRWVAVDQLEPLGVSQRLPERDVGVAHGLRGQALLPPTTRLQQLGVEALDGQRGEVVHPHRTQAGGHARSEEHTSELQSLMRISYAVFCLKTKTKQHTS